MSTRETRRVQIDLALAPGSWTERLGQRTRRMVRGLQIGADQRLIRPAGQTRTSKERKGPDDGAHMELMVTSRHGFHGPGAAACPGFEGVQHCLSTGGRLVPRQLSESSAVRTQQQHKVPVHGTGAKDKQRPLPGWYQDTQGSRAGLVPCDPAKRAHCSDEPRERNRFASILEGLKERG